MSGILRMPDARIVAGGNPMPFSEFRVTQTRTKKSDTFTAKTSMSAIDINWWLTTTPIPIVITINGTQIFTGNAEEADFDFASREFTISGRDKASALIDSSTSEKFLNQKPTDIVKTIAARHGLNVVVDPVSGPAGRNQTTDFDAITSRMTEWTYINKLAEHYGMVAYITNGTLYFKKYDEKLPPYQIFYSPPTPDQYESGNFITLRAQRNLILGRPMKVSVHSHNHHQKTTDTTSATSSAGQGTPLNYHITMSGISPSHAATVARAKLAEIQAHELTIKELSFSGDETVNARMAFTLSGTNSLLDQSYDAHSIDHVVSFKDGYRTSITIKNKKQASGKSASVTKTTSATGGNAGNVISAT